MRIAIIGAGNGGQAMAGHFALLGHSITLYNRNVEKLEPLTVNKTVVLNGEITGRAELELITDNLAEAVEGAELVMITTTADAHGEIARQLAPHLKDGQAVILNPGRTLGAVEFSREFRRLSSKRIMLAEAQSLIYACRASSPGNVTLIGLKDRVPLAALPADDTDVVLRKVNSVFDCFVGARDVLVTSLENIGAIFHPTITLCNLGRIEQQEKFYFYQDITPTVANLVEALDKERLKIGVAYGAKLVSASEWITLAYSKSSGKDIYERIHNNPAYAEIVAPTSLNTRYLYEDIPTGVLPMTELARSAGQDVPLLTSVLELAGAIIGTEKIRQGRSLKQLGLGGVNHKEIRTLVNRRW